MIQSSTTTLTVDGRPLIDKMLTERESLTAVQRFSEIHDRMAHGEKPARYRDLLPGRRPGKGQQYAFEVNLDACTGCKACVAACHNLNGLDTDEIWRDVGILVNTGQSTGPAIQHITTACHHCLEPACLEGCPVVAYEKDPVTGVVRHLDDQCIGCQYCVLKCPYDAPKYNTHLGIVRKCDMCTDRIAEDEAPACAQGCPTKAIRITVVDQQDIEKQANAGRFLTDAPDPGYTRPTTRYLTRRDLSQTHKADHNRSRPEHAHWPLIMMLVLTQLSVGGFVVSWWFQQSDEVKLGQTIMNIHAGVALGFGLLALGASTLHLGRPLYAFRAFIGLKTSWLSREIVGFGLFAKLALLYSTCLWLMPDFAGGQARKVLAASVAGTGIVAVLCSAMIYHDTRRVFWQGHRVIVKFYLTCTILGASSALIAGLLASLLDPATSRLDFLTHWGRPLLGLLILATALKLLFECSIFRFLKSRRPDPMKHTARLMVSSLHQVTLTRMLFGLVGGIGVPALLIASDLKAMHSAALLISVLIVIIFTTVGEVLERYLFFTAVSAPRMPGGLSA